MTKTNTSKNKKSATAVRRKPTQLDRIEETAGTFHHTVTTALRNFEKRITEQGKVLDSICASLRLDHGDRLKAHTDMLHKIQSDLSLLTSGASFMQETDAKVIDLGPCHTIMEVTDGTPTGSWVCLRPDDPRLKASPQEEQGLEDGDYTDASKDVADALTAMGYEWIDRDRFRLSIIRLTGIHENDGNRVMVNGWISSNSGLTHRTNPDFLSRARVTAKKLGLVPREEPKEEWKVGDWVVCKTSWRLDRIRHLPDNEGNFYVANLNATLRIRNWRPATPAEIAEHEAKIKTKADALAAAQAKGGDMLMLHVYDDQGHHIGEAGRF